MENERLHATSIAFTNNKQNNKHANPPALFPLMTNFQLISNFELF